LCTGLWTTFVDSGRARLTPMSMTVTRFLAEEAAHRELPMPPWMFGVLGLLAFAFLLGLTWSFRGTAQKYAPPTAHGEQHGAPEGDTPHWPEHPGHH
jgi:hypothetical protein